MADQVPLFPGNRGCGKRERGAAVVEHPFASTLTGERCVVIRIDGMKTKPKNRTRFASRGGMFASAAEVAEIRERTRKSVLEALGANSSWKRRVVKKIDGVRVRGLETLPCHKPGPSRVVITRLSSGRMDKGSAAEALKPVWDGIADAFGLPDDYELQERGEERRDKCKPGTSSIVVELFFEAGR